MPAKYVISALWEAAHVEKSLICHAQSDISRKTALRRVPIVGLVATAGQWFDNKYLNALVLTDLIARKAIFQKTARNLVTWIMSLAATVKKVSIGIPVQISPPFIPRG